jgi:uncharacterized membrane-anchored protein
MKYACTIASDDGTSAGRLQGRKVVSGWGLALAASLMLFARPGFTQAAAPGEDSGEAATQDSLEDARQLEVREKLAALEWVEGPTTVEVAGNSSLMVPDGYLFLDAPNTARFLEITQNLGSGKEVMIGPATLGWQAYLQFVDDGHVKDDEHIDAPALLDAMKKGTEAANPSRRERGWADVRVVDWAVAPAYNPATKRLEWATVLESKGHRNANFDTRILGRRGHTSVTMVAQMEQLEGDRSALDDVLAGYSFNSGETYADFKPEDKVAEYGLAAMVIGGATAVAAKKGMLAPLLAFLAASWKLVAAVVVGLVAWLGSLFKRKT